MSDETVIELRQQLLGKGLTEDDATQIYDAFEADAITFDDIKAIQAFVEVPEDAGLLSNELIKYRDNKGVDVLKEWGAAWPEPPVTDKDHAKMREYRKEKDAHFQGVWDYCKFDSAAIGQMLTKVRAEKLGQSVGASNGVNPDAEVGRDGAGKVL